MDFEFGQLENAPEDMVLDFSNDLTIIDLPTEMLVEIFSYISTNDLLYNVRNVSKRFASVSKVLSLWRMITICKTITTYNARLIFKRESSFCKILNIEIRQDTDQILTDAIKFCKHLRTIKVYSNDGEQHKMTGPTLRRFLKNMKTLEHIRKHAHNAQFTSYFLFKLASENLPLDPILRRIHRYSSRYRSPTR